MDLVAQMTALEIWPPEDATTQSMVQELARRANDPRKLARKLIHRNILTPFQANLLLTGRGKSLGIGPYVILDRLGEGGMGKVYKAQHRKLRRLVALKIIHPDRVANKLAVERFYREVQAIARLAHPNIVLAYDAEAIGALHYFAMQYVPGTDLARLVREAGPLDPSIACEYMRQAALGLQHIMENNLVHRDIKPSNILIASEPSASSKTLKGAAVATATEVVKIVDLGLSRLNDDGEIKKELTQTGTMMGTPDYMAPEQAMNSHLVDIRTDIYSLGCTFYFALTGRPPFGGGNPLEKLMRHQLGEPEPLETLRPEVPPVLALILRRMMAKKPEDRYQTPLELARDLETITSGAMTPVGNPGETQVYVSETEVPIPAPAADATFQFSDTEIKPPAASRQAKSVYQEQWQWVWVAAAAAAGSLLLLLLLRLIL
jgi:serine/threonine protein kinase